MTEQQASFVLELQSCPDTKLPMLVKLWEAPRKSLWAKVLWFISEKSPGNSTIVTSKWQIKSMYSLSFSRACIKTTKGRLQKPRILLLFFLNSSTLYALFSFLISKSRPTLLGRYGLVACQDPLSTGFPVKDTGVGCHSLLQGIFPNQESNPNLLYWQADSLPLSHQGSPPFILHRYYLNI